MIDSALIIMTMILEAAFLASYVPDAISLIGIAFLVGASFACTLSCVGLEWTFKNIKKTGARLIFG